MSIAARRLQRTDAPDLNAKYKFGFEAGTNGSNVTTSVVALGDTAWGAVGIGGDASLKYDNTYAMTGSLAAHLIPGTSVQTVTRWALPKASTVGAYRYYVRWDANPTADTTIVWLGSNSSTKVTSVVITSAGNIRVYGTPVSSVYTTGAGALPLGQWVRIELAYQVNTADAANSKVWLGVYLGKSTTPVASSGWVTADIGTAGVTYVRVGKHDSAANTTPHWFDAITLEDGATSLLGPIEPSTQTVSPIADAGSLPVGTASYPVPTGAIFLATDGSDSNAGTEAAPVATLTRAIALVPSSGTIVVREGVYNEGEDAQAQTYPYGVWLTKSATIQNYPGEEVWFDGSTPVTGAWTANGSTWSTSYNCVFNRSPTNSDGADDGWGASSGAGGWWTDPSYLEAAWPDMVFYDGTQLTQVTSLAAVTSGTFFVEGADTGTGKWFQGTKLYIGDDPTGHEVRYANKAKFMTMGGTSNTSAMRGIGIRRYASAQATFSSMYIQHSLTMENVWVEDIACGFAHLDSGPATSITKLTARRIGFNVISSNNADNIVVDRADMQGANYAKWNIYGPAIATIKVNHTQFITIKNSIFKDSYSNGFWCDSTCNTPVIVNCLFQNLTNRAIDLETSSDGIVANSKFINNGADTIFINDSDTARIYNCTLAENNWGYRGTGGVRGISTSQNVSPISVGQSKRRYDNSSYAFNIDSRLPTSYYTDYPQHQWTINYVTICNTVIARPGIHAYDTFASDNSSDSFRAAGRTFLADMHPTMNGNVYHWTTQPQYPWIAAMGYGVSPTVRFSLSAWQTYTGQEANSSFTTTDPLNSNYEITSTTYHNNAVALPADIAAFVGQATGTKHAGAFW